MAYYLLQKAILARLFLLTACHVLFPIDKGYNNISNFKSSSVPWCEVTLLGEAAFQKLLKSIPIDRGDKAFMIPYQKRCLTKIKDMAASGEVIK